MMGEMFRQVLSTVLLTYMRMRERGGGGGREGEKERREKASERWGVPISQYFQNLSNKRSLLEAFLSCLDQHDTVYHALQLRTSRYTKHEYGKARDRANRACTSFEI